MTLNGISDLYPDYTSPEARLARRCVLRMMRISRDMPRKHVDPVGHADRQTSMADARAALTIAMGAATDEVGPLGHHGDLT